MVVVAVDDKPLIIITATAHLMSTSHELGEQLIGSEFPEQVCSLRI